MDDLVRNRSYLWYAGGLVIEGSERPHFEGMLAYDGVRHDLDMLLEVDLNGGRAIETGSFSALPDGTFVRDIVATYAEGSAAIGAGLVGREGYVGHFRQTFSPQGPNEMRTSVMRRTGDGSYVPTFPGSDRMIMRRAG